MVFAGEHAVGHFVEYLRQLARVVLADGEDDGLADLAADRIAQGIFEKGFTEELISGYREKPSFKLALLESLIVVIAFVVFERNNEALV
ncbi:MAG: hypothetical protein JW394_0993 [Nitrospira sp.]|nr:hypothetical protein [Nitrospira sp.]